MFDNTVKSLNKPLIKNDVMFRIGLDVGSTTVKLVVVDKNEEILFTKYERHNAKAKDVVINRHYID